MLNFSAKKRTFASFCRNNIRNYGNERENVRKRRPVPLSLCAEVPKGPAAERVRKLPAPCAPTFRGTATGSSIPRAFLRLKNKTQVFYAPDGDHYMSRLTHTARRLADRPFPPQGASPSTKILRRPSRSGTTSGTPPSGMWGSAFSNRLASGGFRHSEQVFARRRRARKGREGAQPHLRSEGRHPQPHEERQPCQRSKARSSRLPTASPISTTTSRTRCARAFFRPTSSPRARRASSGGIPLSASYTAVLDIYEESYGKPYVRMSEEKQAALDELRAFMFEHVYERANKLIQESAERMLTRTLRIFCKTFF